jgi:hypothetical protein
MAVLEVSWRILVQMRSNAKAVVMFVLLAVEAYAHLPM